MITINWTNSQGRRSIAASAERALQMDFDTCTQETAHGLVLESKRAARWQAEGRAAVRVASVFDAPAERVFDAWLDPRIARRWLFATASHPTKPIRIDPRAGG